MKNSAVRLIERALCIVDLAKVPDENTIRCVATAALMRLHEEGEMRQFRIETQGRCVKVGWSEHRIGWYDHTFKLADLSLENLAVLEVMES